MERGEEERIRGSGRRVDLRIRTEQEESECEE